MSSSLIGFLSFLNYDNISTLWNACLKECCCIELFNNYSVAQHFLDMIFAEFFHNGGSLLAQPQHCSQAQTP